MHKYPINVTIDTNIFFGAKFDFGIDGIFHILREYVNDGTINLILSDIVIKEVKHHLKEKAIEVKRIVKKCSRDIKKMFSNEMLCAAGFESFINIPCEENVVQECNLRFEQYINDLKPEILNSGNINANKIIEDYFDMKPPFEEKKKEEFPDAFIIEQVKKRFDKEDIYIISADKGFKRAFEGENYYLLESLSDLFDMINKDKEGYKETISSLKSNIESIIIDIEERLRDCDCIYVCGMSYDSECCIEGYDYDETYLENISDIECRIHSVDQILEETSIVTLNCSADITMICCYNDYENSPWDSEEEKYIYIDRVKLLENHAARFGCTIELNRCSGRVNVLELQVTLGANTLKDRKEISTI